MLEQKYKKKIVMLNDGKKKSREESKKEEVLYGFSNIFNLKYHCSDKYFQSGRKLLLVMVQEVSWT